MEFYLQKDGSVTNDFTILSKENPDYLVEVCGDDEEERSWYEISTFETNNTDYYLEHSEIVDFLGKYFDCVVFDGKYVFDFGDGCDKTRGFFIVKEGLVERFVTWEYAKGMREVYDTLKGGAQ